MFRLLNLTVTHTLSIVLLLGVDRVAGSFFTLGPSSGAVSEQFSILLTLVLSSGTVSEQYLERPVYVAAEVKSTDRSIAIYPSSMIHDSSRSTWIGSEAGLALLPNPVDPEY